MTKRPLSYYLPVLLALFSSIVLLYLAADQESRVMASALIPGGFPFKAYIPGRYTVYLDMDVYPENAAKHLAKMRAVPHLAYEVKGAEHLNVLYPGVWQCGGLSRFTKPQMVQIVR